MDKAWAKNILQQGNYFLYQDISNWIIVVGEMAFSMWDLDFYLSVVCALDSSR